MPTQSSSVTRQSRRLSVVLGLGLVLGSTGCKKDAAPQSAGASSAEGEAVASQIREVPAPVEGQIIVEIDLDEDGDAEVWNVYAVHEDGSRTRVRKDTDLDNDGKADVISEFDGTGALRIERLDGDFDGTYEWVDHYQSGRRVFAEVDSDRNGTSDIFYYYATGEDPEGVLERRERDTDGNGLIDVWERYGDDGTIVVSARDTDGDGKPDVRNE